VPVQNRPQNAFKEIDSPWVKTVLGAILKKLYVSAGVFVVLVDSFGGARLRDATSRRLILSTVCVVYRLKQHGRAGGWRETNILALFFPLKAGLALIEQKPNSSRRGKNTPSEFAKSSPRLGHAASRIRRGKLLRKDKPAACYVLEPRPTKFSRDEN
jgi:hypothetical protein